MGEGPSHLPTDSRLEQVLADFSRRLAAGESISRDDLLSRHPALAEALRSHFAADESAGTTEGQAAGPPERDTAMADPGTEYRPRSSQATIPPAILTPVRSCSLPEHFGRYRVLRCLGQGTMGAVYLADDTELERPVALKIPKFTDDGDEDLATRFYREARAAAHLRHANLCPVYDVGEIDGVRYLSMAYIEGQPLSEVLANGGPLDGRAAATFVLKLARALEVAHGRGVIHRDLKPANIMIDGHQEPMIMDFGLARRINKKEDSRLTQEGMLMGSPAYMSPEQVEGDTQRMGPSCDIYSLGIILYELLTGEVPFKGSIAAVMGQVLSAAPRKPSKVKPGVDPAIEAICLKMIAKLPEDRFASMTEVVRALDAYTSGRPTGVVIPEAYRSSVLPAVDDAQPAPSRGIVIAPWMLLTAVLIIVAGFGVTWRLIAVMMKQQAGPEEVKVSTQSKQALDRGEAKILINDQEVSHDALKHPIELTEGPNKLTIREGETATAIGTLNVPKGDDQPHFAVFEKDKEQFTRKRLHRLIAEWVLAHGGKVKLTDGTTLLAKIEDLPAGDLELVEVHLPKDTPIPSETHQWIRRALSLKRLVVPKGALTQKQQDDLRTAIPDLKIEPAPSEPG
jgi:eukaryotic-like serine/threonine-protein kinase